ncbi:hypothetical protein [Streptomyces sp. YIM 130001]|uniref:hypothetical protein n=1 Tax=Streptomyces sp. YIM 130001 TaxID=2259644 RepID=UPI000E65E917|nr:hypothetical protein [Streptomyces sp. YIM 130001]
MVKNHARKNAAKARRARTGESLQKALKAVRRPIPAGSEPPSEYLYFPVALRPELDGTAPCQDCEGTGLHGGLSGKVVPMDLERSRPGLVLVACSACGGCGRADHSDCPPLHTGDDPHATAAYLARLRVEARDDSPAPTCAACHDREFLFELGIVDAELIEDTPEIANYKARAHAMGEEDDSGLPDGYSLHIPSGLQYLIIPCACAPESEAQVVPAAELMTAAN